MLGALQLLINRQFYRLYQQCGDVRAQCASTGTRGYWQWRRLSMWYDVGLSVCNVQTWPSGPLIKGSHSENKADKKAAAEGFAVIGAGWSPAIESN